jgi:hypothetical protein
MEASSSGNKKQRLGGDTNEKMIECDSSKFDVSNDEAAASPFIYGSVVLGTIAENGWFNWFDGESRGQNTAYSNLRLVSHGIKKIVDKPMHGGPDFYDIANLLSKRNGFNRIGGFCDHCFRSCYDEEDGWLSGNIKTECNTCKRNGWDNNYLHCNCYESHRYGDVLMKLDPRVNPDIEFYALPIREKATLLLKFLRTVASNFHKEHYEQWEKVVLPEGTQKSAEPDLTQIEIWPGYDTLEKEMKEYNTPVYNFIHHLLFTGWAEGDCYRSPGTYSPFRGRLIGCDRDYNTWVDTPIDHGDEFGDMKECFISLHKSDEELTVPVSDDRWPEYTLSTIQYIPETIRRCMTNTIDHQAESLLGKAIADSIDIYRLVRQTYEAQKDKLSVIQWMPCLGVPREDFIPRSTFEGYNPRARNGATR